MKYKLVKNKNKEAMWDLYTQVNFLFIKFWWHYVEFSTYEETKELNYRKAVQMAEGWLRANLEYEKRKEQSRYELEHIGEVRID